MFLGLFGVVKLAYKREHIGHTVSLSGLTRMH